MNESATDVIVARASRSEPLGSMLAGSIAAHVAAIVVLLLLPLSGATDEAPRPVMMISLAGSEGPVTTGITPIGGRAVQEVAPPARVRQPETPPAKAQARMTLPPEKPVPPRETKKSPPEATSSQPSKGAEVTEGNTPVDTGARGHGFGSSSGGSGTASVQLDSDFCCTEYVATIQQLIRRNWDQNQGLRGATVMKFTILKDGRLNAIEVERPSGQPVLDLAARRALAVTTLPPLPDRYTNPTLTVYVTFTY
jgi:TonB family protein